MNDHLTLTMEVSTPASRRHPLPRFGHGEDEFWPPYGTVIRCPACKRSWVHVGDGEGYPYWSRRLRALPIEAARRVLRRLGRPRDCAGAPTGPDHA